MNHSPAALIEGLLAADMVPTGEEVIPGLFVLYHEPFWSDRQPAEYQRNGRAKTASLPDREGGSRKHTIFTGRPQAWHPL
jgi:hypothetical protein